MRRSPDVSPRRLSDISPQLRQLKYLVVDEAIKEDLKWSRSVEDLTGGPAGLTSIEERILRITGYYGYQPWATSYKSKTARAVPLLAGASPPGKSAGKGHSTPLLPAGWQLHKEAWRQLSGQKALGGGGFPLLSAVPSQPGLCPVILRARLCGRH